MENFKLLETQFNITHDCLRSFIFAGHIASIKDKADAWHSIADMCFADGVIGWNMIFGTKSQPTHWQKFNEMVPPPDKSGLLPFSKNVILQTVGFNEQQWANYHLELVNFRNRRIAHLSHLDSHHSIPDIQPAFSAVHIYRDWLLHLAKAYKMAGHSIETTTELANQVTAKFRDQISELFTSNV